MILIYLLGTFNFYDCDAYFSSFFAAKITRVIIIFNADIPVSELYHSPFPDYKMIIMTSKISRETIRS